MAQTQTQNLKSMIEKTYITYSLGEGVIFSADIKSRSRKDLVHYSRIVLDPMSLKIVKATCSCEAFAFHKKCWHLKLLEKLLTSEEFKEKIENAAKEIMRIEDDIANWG
ncbi:MAG: SWIM zinc finger family protein [Sulfolobus sp.]